MHKVRVSIFTLDATKSYLNEENHIPATVVAARGAAERGVAGSGAAMEAAGLEAAAGMAVAGTATHIRGKIKVGYSHAKFVVRVGEK